jgi:hypothetical protein
MRPAHAMRCCLCSRAPKSSRHKPRRADGARAVPSTKNALAQLPSAAAFVALRRTPEAKPDRQAFVGFGDPLFVADGRDATRRNGVRNLGVPAAKDATDAVLEAAATGTRFPARPSTRSRAISRSETFALFAALPDTADELNEIAAVPDADTTAIQINVDNVTIDLNGFAILGPTVLSN